MKFREHRRFLDEAMETVVEVADRAALVEHIRTLLEPWGRTVTDGDLVIAPYAHDDRIGWDTYIVTIKGYGVIGFTNGPLAYVG
jgi:hypothetical protein